MIPVEIKFSIGKTGCIGFSLFYVEIKTMSCRVRAGVNELVLLNRLHVSKLLAMKLSEPILPEYIERCTFGIASGAYGGSPTISVNGSGKHKDRTFWFKIAAKLYGNEYWLVMSDPSVEAYWE